MKIIIAFFLSLFGVVVFGATNYCQLNGYSASEIYHRESAIAQALKDDEPSHFADQVHYPLRIDLNEGTHIVTTANQLERSFAKIFTPADRLKIVDRLNQQPKKVICRSEGVGLLDGGLWLNPNDLKLMSINHGVIPHTHIVADQPYGHAIQAITSHKVLKNFVKLYNQLHHKKVIDGSALFIVKISPHMYQLNAEDNSGVIQLYYADINNSGQKDYILVYEHQGTLHTDRIRFIGRVSRDSLQPLQLKKLIHRTYHINDDRWYLFHSTPFLTTKGLTYLSYNNNGVVCTYLWKVHTIRLVSKDSKHCITKSKK